jgi:hypothetical protein
MHEPVKETRRQADKDRMSKRQKIFGTSAVVAAVAAIGGFGAFSAFTATTQNDNNTIQSGSVAITDTDSVGGTAGVLYSSTNQKPGQANAQAARCIRVSYSGSLPASVRLYRGSVTNGTEFQLLVERGSGLTAANNTMSCAGFTPAATNPTAYNGTLASFPASYAASTVHGKDAGAAWSSGDSVDYRFTVYPIDDATANNHVNQFSTGVHSIFWEAQNN